MERPGDMETAKRMALFGEALIDDFITEQVVGGAPFNVARNLAAFGAAPLMVTRIGQDRAGGLIQAEYERFGMDQAGLQHAPGEDTGRVVVERGPDGHRFIILDHQAYDLIDPDQALAAVSAHRPALLYFGTLAQRGEVSRAALRALWRDSHLERYLDLNLRDGQATERCVYESLCAADIVKVNEEELNQLFGWYTHQRHDTADMGEERVRQACRALLRIFELKGLIVTLGERGAVYFRADGAIFDSGASSKPVQVVDTVGAGDAFSAIFLLGHALGWPVADTLARANEFAGAICGVSGAVPADLSFYRPFATRWLAR
jgi:fructokinase